MKPPPHNPTIAAHVAELVEQSRSFFSRKTEPRAKQEFQRHRDQLLEQVPRMGMVGEYPVYAALALLGRFQFEEGPQLRALARDPSAETLDAARAAKSIRLAASAQAAWDHLLANEPEALCVIVATCYVAGTKKEIQSKL